MPQISEIIELSSSLLIDKSLFYLTENEKKTPFTHLHNTKVSTTSPSLDKSQIISSFMTQLSEPTPKTFVKTSYHPYPPDRCII